MLSRAAARWLPRAARCSCTTAQQQAPPLSAAAAGGTPAQQASGRYESTYSRQRELPRLPVCKLEDTMPKLLRSVAAVASEDELQATQAAVDEFIKGPGPELQRRLEEHASQDLPNWLEQWWDNMYLETRTPNPVDVNYSFIMREDFSGVSSEAPQVDRAARLISGVLDFKRLVDTETLPPAAIPRGNTPLCMSQTARIFNHARIPRATRDELVNYGTAPKGLDGLQHFATKWTGDNPRHLAIIGPSGMIHCMDVVDDSGNALSTEHIAAGLEALLAEDAKVALPELSLAHFTGASRTKWAECRDMVLDVHKDHKSTLHDIDSAMFVLVLDQRAPETLVDMARLFLHGQGAPRWFDKHQLIVCANGVAGWNFEHAPGDGTTSLPLLEHSYRHSIESAKAGPRASGGEAPALWQPPVHMLPEVLEALEDCQADLNNVIASLEQDVLAFDDFGATRIKQLGVSPDAFAQMAIQLTQYRLSGRCVGTYESGAMRHFLHGRTETIRSASVEVKAFVEGFGKGGNDAELIKEAATAHNAYVRMCQSGQGIDRHLFGLRKCISDEEETPSLFEDEGYTKSATWRLSTSNCTNPSLLMFSFGPVVEDGLGIGYYVAADDMNFSVSSYEAAEAAGSAPGAHSFVATLNQSLHDMAAALEKAL